MLNEQHSALAAALSPRSIVVVGASEDSSKTGGRAIQMLRHFGYSGDIYAVNPNRADVQGIRTFSRVHDLPVAPDLAIIALPAAAAVEAIGECAAHGVKIAIITTSGFAETGSVGRDLQDAMIRTARAHGMRIVGPNSQGLANFGSGAVASFSSILLETEPLDGPVAVISQSGAMSVVPYRWLRDRGIGVRHAHSTGNDSDVTVSDLTLAVLEDPSVRLILLYLESLADPDTLARAAAIARDRDIPIVALKAGRSARGQRAAHSHTGALATHDRIVDAFLSRHGIWRAIDTDELMRASELYLKGWRPKGTRLAIVSDSGATGVMACDAVDRLGLSVADLSAITRRALASALPSFASTANPIDLTSVLRTSSHLFGECLHRLADDPAVDMIFIGFPASGTGYDLDAFARSGREFAARGDKPIVFSVPQPEKAHLFAAAGIPTFLSDTTALQALSQLAHHAALMRQRPPPPATMTIDIPARIGLLDEAASLDFLGRCGLPVVEHRLCQSFGEAEEAMRSLAAPVVLKGCSSALPHKSEHGLVILGVDGKVMLADGYRHIVEKMATLGMPNAGIIVARMEQGIHELFIGARNDPVFGSVILLGDGGIDVEAKDDVITLKPPISIEEIRAHMERLRIAPRLKGVRGKPAADLDAVSRIAWCLSCIISGAGNDITSIDLNPVVVRREGEGATIVDAVIERSRN